MKRYRDNKIHKTGKGWQWLMLIAVMLVGVQVAEAQVLKPFTQRTAAETPDQKIYNIKGDFQMIGNTNLTRQYYSDTGSNNTTMVYVDKDNDSNTLNSSSATLSFSTENGAVPDCSNIIYAGLYWTGRAHDEDNSDERQSPMQFYIGGTTNNRTNGNSFNGYNLSIASASHSGSPIPNNTSNNKLATYTLSSSGNTIIYRFYSWRTGNSNSTYVYHGVVTKQIGSGTPVNIPGSITSTGSDEYIFTFTDADIIDASGQEIRINSLRKRRNSDSSISSYFFANISTGGKPLNKGVIKLKHANASSYTTVTAEATDIYAPSNQYGNMYSAYAEVTDYVRTHRLGEYFVADMALREGNGGGTGYYGGWGMIVVYENPKMKWRDITIFDGHAYVASGNYSYELPVSGFNTAQTGNVEMKLGLIAGEGDVSISGDYFDIQVLNTNQWHRLSHNNNTTGNFFNSSILSEPRNPKLKNNTGIDIAMFNINNANNSIIDNKQTSTKFRYGSTQDTYIISTIAMAVDAYVPEVEPVNSVVEINGNSIPANYNYTVEPGDEVTFEVVLKNKGTEAVNNFKIEIPVPFSASSIKDITGIPSSHITPNYVPAHDGGSPGKIIWDIGTLPLLTNTDDVLATLRYTLKVTEDCALLVNSACNDLSIDGITTGIGATSNSELRGGGRFISGFEFSAQCEGLPIYAPINLIIDASNSDCGDYIDPELNILTFEYCGISEVPLDGATGLRGNFPTGTRFYSAIEKYYIAADGSEVSTPPTGSPSDLLPFVRKAQNAEEYNSTNKFPATPGLHGPYYAIVPGTYVTCYWKFEIDIEEFCGNFWIGTNSTDWGTASNWTMGIPGTGTLDNNVTFATNANNNNRPAVKNLVLDIDRTINKYENNTAFDLIIPTEKQLTINGTVTDANALGGTIIVQADKDKATGTLILNPDSVTNVGATVQFYNKAYTCTDCGTPNRQQWQYFGVPVKTINSFPYTTGNPETIFEWSEAAFGDKWITPSTPLAAFRGYEINNSTLSAHNINPLTTIYNFAGTLNVGDATVPLTYTSSVNYKGWNLIGNSYTAAIPIATAISYSGGWNSTVYLFNAGSRNSWRKLTGNTEWGLESGRYVSVPLNTAGSGGLPSIIPSMHAFMIETTSAGNLTLDYSKLTKNALVEGANGSSIVWRSASSQPTELPFIVMDVIGTESADRVWLFENMTTTRGFDAGWDGEKVAESGLMQLYVKSDDELKLQVATVPQLQGTTLVVKPDNNDNFKISFSVSSEVEARGLHMRDLITGRAYPIRNLAEYSVAGVANEVADRFRVVAIADENMSKQEIGNSIVEIFAMDNQIGVANNSDEICVATVYDAAGKVVAKLSVNQGSTTIIGSSQKINTGIYVVKVSGQTVNETKRVMVR